MLYNGLGPSGDPVPFIVNKNLVVKVKVVNSKIKYLLTVILMVLLLNF